MFIFIEVTHSHCRWVCISYRSERQIFFSIDVLRRYRRTFFCHVKTKVLRIFLSSFFPPFRDRWSSFSCSSYRPVVKIGKCLVVVCAWPSGTRRREQAAGCVHELKDSLSASGESSAHGKWTLRVLFLSSPPALYRPRVASTLRISARFFPRFSFGRSSFILDERQSSKRVKETCTLST